MNTSKKTSAYYEQIIRDYYALEDYEKEFSEDYADEEEEEF